MPTRHTRAAANHRATASHATAIVSPCEVLSCAKMCGRLFELRTAGGAQFLHVRYHARGDPRYIRDNIGAELEGVLRAGSPLLRRAFRADVCGKTREQKRGHRRGRKNESLLRH